MEARTEIRGENETQRLEAEVSGAKGSAPTPVVHVPTLSPHIACIYECGRVQRLEYRIVYRSIDGMWIKNKNVVTASGLLRSDFLSSASML